MPKIIMCALLGLLCVGCKTSMRSPREAFLMGTKNDRTNYIRLYEISPESLQDNEHKELQTIKNVVRGIREASLQCTNDCPLIQDRLQRIEHAAEIVHRGRLDGIGKLRDVYDFQNDTVLFFDYKTEARRELGWVVMTGQKIKKRIVYAEGVILPND